jgi:hypothetical protein
VWGWNYRTLQGHLETGQMTYEVWKWCDSGAVEFHIDAFSRAARIPNPIVRLGFRVFGRREQERFARLACERMARLTTSELERRPPDVQPLAGAVAVQPASETARLGGRLARQASAGRRA